MCYVQVKLCNQLRFDEELPPTKLSSPRVRIICHRVMSVLVRLIPQASLLVGSHGHIRIPEYIIYYKILYYFLLYILYSNIFY